MTIDSDEEVEPELDSDVEEGAEGSPPTTQPQKGKQGNEGKRKQAKATAASDAAKSNGGGSAAARDKRKADLDADFAFDADDPATMNDWVQKGWDFRGAIQKLADVKSTSSSRAGTALEERIAAKRGELKHLRRAAKKSSRDADTATTATADVENDETEEGGSVAAWSSSEGSDSGSDDDYGRAVSNVADAAGGTDDAEESAGDDSDGDDDDDNAASIPEEADAIRDYGMHQKPAADVNADADADAAGDGDDDGADTDDGGEGADANDAPARRSPKKGRGEKKDKEGEDDEETREERRAREFFEEPEEYAGTVPLPFQALNLSRPILRAIESMGFVAPTPVQERAIPYGLAGRDMCVSAATGSGKTAAFLLPVLERLLYRPRSAPATRVLVVTPTRELAVQVHSMGEALARFTDIRCCLITGGAKNLRSQEAELRGRPDIVVCTPGRMVDHLTNSHGVHLDDLEILVLDEADRLLELGFQDEVAALIKSCPRGRQSMLFSATMNTKVDELVRLSLNKPMRVKADPVNQVAQRLVQEFVRIRKSREVDREAILLSLLCRTFTTRTIVFFDTKAQAHRAMLVLGMAGVAAAELHGNLTMAQRLEAMERFKAGDVHVLVATDLAARGLDIAASRFLLPSHFLAVHTVINYEMPRTRDTYIHRVGRTARAGCGGRSVTLIGEDRRLVMKEVLRTRDDNAEVKSRSVPQSVIDHYRSKVEEMEDSVAAIIREERVEREHKVAEMEINKASNLLEHREEIMARPPRDWITSAKRKAEVADAATAKAKGGDGDGGGSGDLAATRKKAAADAEKDKGEKGNKKGKEKHRLTRKKRRRLEAAAADAAEATAAAEEGGAKPPTAASMKGLAKKAKREAREQEHVYKDRPAGAVRGSKRKLDVGDGGLFDADLWDSKRAKADGADKVGKAGKAGDDEPASRYKFTDFDPNRRLNRKGKPSVNKFKSKAKFKRR
ncbi:unnamed protein product [Phaeothamnion confervicola]